MNIYLTDNCVIHTKPVLLHNKMPATKVYVNDTYLGVLVESGSAEYVLSWCFQFCYEEIIVAIIRDLRIEGED